MAIHIGAAPRTKVYSRRMMRQSRRKLVANGEDHTGEQRRQRCDQNPLLERSTSNSESAPERQRESRHQHELYNDVPDDLDVEAESVRRKHEASREHREAGGRVSDQLTVNGLGLRRRPCLCVSRCWQLRCARPRSE
jgi:hypothetical protein